MELSTSTNMVAFTPGRMRNPMEYCIQECARGGYRILDINFCEAMNPWSRMRDDDWEAYVRRLGRLGEELGVCFRQSHLPYYDAFAAEDPDPVMEELIRRSIIASGMLGVNWAVTHPMTDYVSVESSMARNLSYYTPYLELAKKCGTGICLENDFGFQPNRPDQLLYCADIRELVALTDAFGDSGHIGICYDFGHANLCPNADHVKNLWMIGARLKALHIQDNHGTADEHLMPFHGNIPWKSCMEELARMGYSGDLTYEIQEFGRFLPNDQKHLVVEYSQKIGRILLAYMESANKT